MGTELESNLLRVFKSLAERVAEIVASGQSEGLLTSRKVTYVRDRIDAVRQTEHGIVRSIWDTEFITKEVWGEAARIVSWRSKELDEYQIAHQLLSESVLSENDKTRLLEQYTQRLAYALLDSVDSLRKEEHLTALLSLVVKHFNGEKVRYSSEVRLKGVFPPAEGIRFDVSGTEFYLRRIDKSDMAREEYHSGFRESFPDDPSAILQVTFPGSGTSEIQKKVEQAITILRLFKVGSARYISYNLDSESLVDNMVGGILSGGKHQVGHEQYVIGGDDVSKLQKFWQHLSEILPAKGLGYSSIEVEPIAIAYQRYSDALLAFGTIERRIAETVMGLESLFLRGSENQELAYRLRMRVAKVLGLLGYDPYVAKKVANDSYTIRSAFVHGDVVQEKDRRDIEKRHGSLTNLLKLALNELRIAIIVLLVIGQGKDQVISLIDDSFIDLNKLPELEKLLETIGSSIAME